MSGGSGGRVTGHRAADGGTGSCDLATFVPLPAVVVGVTFAAIGGEGLPSAMQAERESVRAAISTVPRGLRMCVLLRFIAASHITSLCARRSHVPLDGKKIVAHTVPTVRLFGDASRAGEVGFESAKEQRKSQHS